MELRRVVVGSLVACVMIAMAPWFSGGQEPIALLIAGMALLLGTLMTWLQPEVRVLRWSPLSVAYLGLLAFGMLSLVWSANRYSTGLWLVEWGLAAMVFWMAFVVAGERRGRSWLVNGYLVSAAIFCVVAMWMYLTSAYPRLTGPFYWPNPAAAYLIPAILLAADGLRRSKGKRLWLWGAQGTVYSFVFLLTDSRAATLVLLVVLGIYFLVVPLKRREWTRIVFVLLLGLMSSILLVRLSTLTTQHNATAIPGSRFAEAASGESRSLSDRLYYLESAVSMWVQHPLQGTGAGTYGDVHPQYQQRVVSAATSAHNVYVQTLAELGAVGAGLLAVVLLSLAAGIVRGVVQEPARLALALGLLGLLMHFGLDIDVRYPALLMLAAVFAGVLYAERVPTRAGITWRRPALAALLIVPLVSLYQSDTWAVSAKASEDDGDYAQAASKYALSSRGVLYNPDYVNAEGIALYALAATGAPDAKTSVVLAQQRAQRAQRLDPHDGQHHQLEGRVLALKGDLKGAEVQFRQALALDRFNHPDYALDLASVQVRAGDLDGAVKTAQTMLSQYPEPVVANRNADVTLRPTLANLEEIEGNVYLRKGDLINAAAAGRRALRYDPAGIRGRALVNQVEKAAQIGAQ
jgi:O-antigen ligase